MVVARGSANDRLWREAAETMHGVTARPLTGHKQPERTRARGWICK